MYPQGRTGDTLWEREKEKEEEKERTIPTSNLVHNSDLYKNRYYT